MNNEAEIAAMKASVDTLEDEFVLLHDSLNKRIDDMHTEKAHRLTIWSIAVAVVIGVIQVAVALFTFYASGVK